MNVTNLMTLGVSEPIGIDEKPYFSWMLESDMDNTVQKSYHLKVYSEEEMVFDSGIVESKKNSFITYEGKPLRSCTVYNWSVVVTDNHGNEAEANSVFETGLLAESDWKANWVKSPLRRKKSKSGFGNQGPSTYFRKIFDVEDKPVSARVYATCHGIYDLLINGEHPDERFLAPEHTVYGKYLCYQTYDITSFINTGINVLGMVVSDGWYHGPNTRPNFKKPDNAHAVLFQIEITYADGTREIIGSDSEVRASYGPVQSADLFAGEYYDAREELDGWLEADYEDGPWKRCKEVSYGYSNLRAQNGEPVRVVQEVPVKELIINGADETIIDFGQNLAGVVRFKASVPSGTEIILDHCEVLDKNGNYYNNILSEGGVGKGADQRDVYVSNGKPSVYQPRFTYHGFRYVRVQGTQVNPDDFVACVLSTKKNDVGYFECSDERFNRLYENIRWSQKSNMLSIPTDCPQREKAGWTGDMLVYSKTAMLNEDCTSFFTRWLENMSADQDEYGSIPMVTPFSGVYIAQSKLMQLMNGGKGVATSSGWGDAAVIVPWSMYQVTGDTVILRKQYETMKRWCDYVIHEAATRSPKGCKTPEEYERYIWDTGFHYGEWLVPSQSKNGIDMKNLNAIIAQSSCYTAPIFGWHSVDTFAQIASILADECLEDDYGTDNVQGKESYAVDAKKYSDIAAKMKNAIQHAVILPDGTMPSDLMGAYVLPLHFDLVPEKYLDRFARKLVNIIAENDYCMDTGFLATPFLLDALCKIDRMDLAWKLLCQTKVPSWLYEVEMGATTIWESCFGYDDAGNPGSLSFNHYAFGAVADWIYRNIGAIYDGNPGFTEVVLKPVPIPGLTYARRDFVSTQGRIQSCWQVQKSDDGDVFAVDVLIPCNTTAEIILPNGTVNKVGSGTYHYEINMAEA